MALPGTFRRQGRRHVDTGNTTSHRMLACLQPQSGDALDQRAFRSRRVDGSQQPEFDGQLTCRQGLSQRGDGQVLVVLYGKHAAPAA